MPLVMHVRVVSGHGGGPDKTILNSPRYLAEQGFRGLCVYLRDPGDQGFSVLAERAKAKRAPLEAVDDFGLRDWRIIGRLKSLVDEHRPLIWHGHDYKSNLIGLILNRQLQRRRASANSPTPPNRPMRLVTTVHGWVQRTWKTPLYFFVDRQCLPRYERVVCVSTDLRDECVRLGVPADRLSLIDNAIALDDYELELTPAQARRQLRVDPERPLLAAVGRLSAEKGFDRLIDAVADLNDSGLEIGLAIAGSGDEQANLKAKISARGMADRVRLLGFCDDPRVLYRAADLFVLSSLREGLPNVILEAMAMQTPVLSTRVAGIPKLIDDDVNGRLVDAHQVAALRTAIAELISEPDTRSRLASAGYSTIEQRFSFRDRMSKMVAVYESLGTIQGLAGVDRVERLPK